VLEFDVDGQTVGENNYVGDFDGGQYFTGVLDVWMHYLYEFFLYT